VGVVHWDNGGGRTSTAVQRVQSTAVVRWAEVKGPWSQGLGN